MFDMYVELELKKNRIYNKVNKQKKNILDINIEENIILQINEKINKYKYMYIINNFDKMKELSLLLQVEDTYCFFIYDEIIYNNIKQKFNDNNIVFID